MAYIVEPALKDCTRIKMLRCISKSTKIRFEKKIRLKIGVSY